MLSFMKRLLLCLFLATISLHASDIWGTDYPAALTQAASSKKPILLEFTGSDWCPPCMKLTKTVFEQPVFEDFAKENTRIVGYQLRTPEAFLKWVQDNRK